MIPFLIPRSHQCLFVTIQLLPTITYHLSLVLLSLSPLFLSFPWSLFSPSLFLATNSSPSPYSSTLVSSLPLYFHHSKVCSCAKQSYMSVGKRNTTYSKLSAFFLNRGMIQSHVVADWLTAIFLTSRTTTNHIHLVRY